MQTSCIQSSSSSKYIIRNPLFEHFKKLMITTRNPSGKYSFTRNKNFFYAFHHRESRSKNIFYKYISRFREMQVIFDTNGLQNKFFYNVRWRIWGSLIFQQNPYRSPTGLHTSIFLTRMPIQAQTSVTQKNRMILDWNKKKKNDLKLRSKK